MKKTNFTFLPVPKISFQWLMPLCLIIAMSSTGLKLSAQCALACNSMTQVSLDENCMAEVTPDMILNAQTTSCPNGGPFFVDVLNGNTIIPTSPFVNEDWIGYTLTARVTDPVSNNSCWGHILIEDKLPPVIDCPDEPFTIACYELDTFVPDAIDACDGPVVPTLLSETVDPNDCVTDPPNILKTVTRVYQATDSRGYTSEPCTIQVQLERINLDDIVCPLSWDIAQGNNPPIQCDEVVDNNNDGVPDPEFYGVPTINGIPLYPLTDFNCNISVTFQDTPLPEIGCVQKIMRIWTIREWFCSGELTRVCDPQILEIVDDEGPSITCPPDMTVSTNGYTCEMDVLLPPATVSDNCANPVTHVDVAYPGGFLDNSNGGYVTLPAGVHIITYTAYDDCHNSNECTMTVVVEDHTPPVPVCDEFTVVSVTLDGEAEVHASVFDDGSYDDCQLKKMLVRRMDDGCPDCEKPKFDGFDFIGEYEGHYYYLSHYLVTGERAHKLAAAMGGYVANLETPTEHDWLFDEIRSFTDHHYYIGLNDLDYEGQFEWSNGAALTYQRWANNQPDGNGDYVLVRPNGRWNDVRGMIRMERYVLEIEDPCGWSSYERFCCADIGTDIMVAFRAVDTSGNYNDCMVTVEVQDKLPPKIICPPDLSIECAFDFTDLSVFGNVVTDPADRQPIGVPEQYIINYYGELIDGLATDNCDVQVTETPTMNINQCGIGYIERTFTATDDGGREISCTQRIYIGNSDPFDGHTDIIWPVDVDMDGCSDPDAFGPDVTGKPTFIEDECDLVGATYEDQVFPFNNSDGDACFKILRHWTVIDWCQFENGEYPYWTWTQVIKINNSVAPTLTGDCSEQSTCTFDNTCRDGFIELIMTATDDCTAEDELFWEYKVDLDNDGSFDYTDSGNGGTADASDEYPIGEHTIVWTFEDRCGNKTSCEQPFTIVNCKAPTPYCIDGLAVDLMPVDTDDDGEPDWGMIEIWASDFDLGSSHPCGLDVTVSFSPDPSDNLRVFDCTHVGEQMVDMYASVQTPMGLVQAFCTASIDIQDNMDVCPDDDDGGQGGVTAIVSGLVSTEMDEDVADVSVRLEGSELEAIETTENGSYAFPAMPIGGNYEVDPSKNNDILNGVSTLDLVLIQKHILGLDNLESAYKIIAADVNHDERVTASDIVGLRKVILGVETEFPNNESWRFIDAAFTFDDPTDPLSENFPEVYTITGLDSDMQVDFTALKVGDVNSSASANNFAGSEVRGTSSLTLSVQDQVFGHGETVRIPFNTVEAMSLMGYQFTIEFDADLLEFAGFEAGSVPVTEDHFGMHRLEEGILTTSWHDTEHIDLGTSDALFYMTFVAKRSATVGEAVNLSSRHTMAEAYSNVHEAMAVELVHRSEDGLASGSFRLYQNTPNPFSSTTTIGFHLPTSSSASLTVYDVTGKTLYTSTANYVKGYNEVTLDQAMLNSRGVMYYTLETEGYTATKKMVVLK